MPRAAPLTAEPAGPAVTRTLVGVAIVLAGLHVGRDVLIPLALALLLSVALVPVARTLERIGIPRVIAAVTVVVVAALATLTFIALLLREAVALAASLPAYETNLRAKIRALGDGSSVFGPLVRMLRGLAAELGGGGRFTPLPAAPEPVAGAPSAESIAADALLMVTGPLATGVIVLLFATYLLLQRNDVRDRFVRLWGGGDIPRATAALGEAGRRISRYLLGQLVVNLTFGTLMAAGLWLIGIPNALLWGLLGFILRFIPFVGGPLGAFFPFVLSLAVDPGWTAPLLVIGLFAAVEAFCAHVLEVLFNSAATGLSPLPLVVIAALSTVIWGPIGLVLAPPFAACLLIAARHVPRLATLELLLGQAPVLDPPQRFYQRMLAGDRHEAVEIAERMADEDGIAACVRYALLPAARSLAQDLERGALDHETVERASRVLLAASEAIDDPPREQRPALLCVGAGAVLDQAVATALAAMLTDEGVPARAAAREREATEAPAVVLVMARHATARRVRRALARLSVSVGAEVPVLVVSQDDAAVADAARATGAVDVVAPEAVRRAVARHGWERPRVAAEAPAQSATVSAT
jgi:predicted PurR-regulated permease PerM